MVRVSHEISHSWFGLVIGAMDWTEEWLSEGFATFMEDPIHSLAMEKVQNELGHDHWSWTAQLRSAIRFLTLESELENTNPEMQAMRPMKDRSGDGGTGFVKNGMNPEGAYTQVHYIKGYFLLR